jgi:hypothetical protein
MSSLCLLLALHNLSSYYNLAYAVDENYGLQNNLTREVGLAVRPLIRISVICTECKFSRL